MALPQKVPKAALIHTGLQPGDKQSTRLVNRFNGLLVFSRHSRDWLRKTCPANDTEKPLKRFRWFLRSFLTGLKPGVNESKTLRLLRQSRLSVGGLRSPTRTIDSR